MTDIKIVHLGDMQYEIRTGGKMSQRLNEYRFVNEQTVKLIKDEQPDIVVIAGDVYEYNAANGDETKLFAEFLRAVLPNTKRIVIIPGNHDLKQKANMIIDDDNARNTIDFIDSVVFAIDDAKISYYNRSGFYTDSAFPITWVVWSQTDKHSAEYNPVPYNPWLHEKSEPTGASIELYHDPVRNCTGFDGSEMKVFSNYSVSIDDFKCNTVLAGDIHTPKIIQKDNFTFAYCSSLIQRNFGEGNYYSDNKLTVNGNDQHGLNIIKFNIAEDRVTDIKFVPVKSVVGRHTIYLSDDFNYKDNISILNIIPSGFDHIRLTAKGNINDFIKAEENIVKHFQSLYNCTIELSYDNVKTDIENLEVFDDIEQLADTDKIKEIAYNYIDKTVEKTSTISTENQEDAKKLFREILEQELQKVDLSTKQVNIRLMYAEIDNFMSFGCDIKIDMSSNDMARITGTNGIGKTTLYRFIAWMLTDRAAKHQNDRNKKLNYHLLFNDKSREDSVSGKLVFYVNSSKHTLVKTLSRSWKKDSDDKMFSKDAIEYLSGTPKLSMTLESDELTSTDTTEILEYLSSIVSYSEFKRHVLVDQASLDELIHSKSDDLNQEILYSLGLDFLDRLNDRYDTIREQQLRNIDKPSITIEAANQKIAEAEESIARYSESLDSTNLEINTLSNKQTAEESKLNMLFAKLNNVDTVETIEHNIQRLESSLQLLSTEKESLAIKLNDLNTKKIALSADALQSDKVKLSVELNTLENKIATVADKILQLEKEEAQEKNNLVQTGAVIKAEYNEEVHILESSLSEAKVKSYEANTAALNIRDGVSKKIEGKIDAVRTSIKDAEEKHNNEVLKLQEIRNELNTANTEIEATVSAIKLLKSKIETVESSKICTACNREHDHTTLEKVKVEVQKLKKVITEHKNTELKLTTAKDNILGRIDTQSAAVESSKEAVKKNNVLLELLIGRKNEGILSFAKIFADDVEQYDKHILESQRYTDRSTMLEAKISEAKSKVLESVKADSRIAAIVENINTISSNKAATAAEKPALEIELNKLQEKLSEVDLQLTEIKTIDTNITAVTEDISNISKSISSTELDIKGQHILKAKAVEDIQINIEIQEQQLNISNIKKEITEATDLTFDLKSSILSATDSIADLKEKIISIRAYSLTDAVLRLYKRMLSKAGLPQYIFQHIIPLLNSKLNELLSGVQFRLYFDEDDLQLKMLDLSKNVIRPVTHSGGMEVSMMGLSLTFVLKQLNAGKRFKELFIDEITGKLNDGKNLSYAATDYKHTFVKFLNKISKECKVYIIDHVIDDLRENSVIEVYSTSAGSSAVKQTTFNNSIQLV